MDRSGPDGDVSASQPFSHKPENPSRSISVLLTPSPDYCAKTATIEQPEAAFRWIRQQRQYLTSTVLKVQSDTLIIFAHHNCNGTKMGAVSSSIADKMKSNMEESQGIMMQKQKAMQMEMIKRQRAIQLAMAKDRLYWFGTFTGTTLLLGVLGSVRKKSPIPLLPMVPLSFLFGYQFDMVYGDKLTRVQTEAERLMSEKPQILELPKFPHEK